MKPLRALLTILAIAAAAFLAFRGCRGAAPPKPTETPPTPVDDDPNAPSPFDRGPKDSKPAEPTPAPPPESDVDKTLAGTPVKPDADTSLVVPYRTGVKCRYRVKVAELYKNRDTGEAAWGRFNWIVSTEVVKGDGSGAARVRFQNDSFVYQTEAPGRRIEIDSQHPDQKLLDDKQFGLARILRPWIATCGMPVEFVIDEGGVIRRVEGVNALNRKFLDVVSTFGTQEEQNADDAPTVESMIEKWSECLFPPLGVGKLKAEASRDIAFRKTYVDRWACLASGNLRATHDDPGAFRVEFKGMPAIEELNNPAKHPKFMTVEKAKIIASADSYVASWRFDREQGRLLASTVTAKYCLVVAFRAGQLNGVQQFEHPYTDIERHIDVEIIEP